MSTCCPFFHSKYGPRGFCEELQYSHQYLCYTSTVLFKKTWKNVTIFDFQILRSRGHKCIRGMYLKYLTPKNNNRLVLRIAMGVVLIPRYNTKLVQYRVTIVKKHSNRTTTGSNNEYNDAKMLRNDSLTPSHFFEQQLTHTPLLRKKNSSLSKAKQKISEYQFSSWTLILFSTKND